MSRSYETDDPPLPITLKALSYQQKLLSGLGKATRRGIKKCAKCGYLNGTRSATCKNKKCSVLLKDSEEKSKELDAIKLITGTVRQVYSVRVRDVGPTYRGFVQLPIVDEETQNVLSEMALCFVDSCQRLFDDSILKCHEEIQSTSPICAHINAALESCSLATPIEFNRDVLDKLQNVSQTLKDKLRLLASETDGPLVQRVSKAVMAVKCQVTPKQPLGYLHFTFARGKGNHFEKYSCSCTETIHSNSIKASNVRYKCIHYYTCVCALASSAAYLEEFAGFISTAFATHSSNKINVEIRNEKSIITRSTPSSSVPVPKINKRKIVENKNKSTANKEQCTYSKMLQKRALAPKSIPVEIKVLGDGNLLSDFQLDAVWPFLDWLSFITESINATMRFENCGIVNTLIFQAPENFYGNFKKRIPSVYCSDQRQLHDPAAYYIMNILHLKEIFDTPKVKLKISKKYKYIQSELSGYVEYDENDEHNQNFSFHKPSFIFFLNVGQSTVDESDNTNNSFIIEWLPNISSQMKIGQLKLLYKYGRKST